MLSLPQLHSDGACALKRLWGPPWASVSLCPKQPLGCKRMLGLYVGTLGILETKHPLKQRSTPERWELAGNWPLGLWGGSRQPPQVSTLPSHALPFPPHLHVTVLPPTAVPLRHVSQRVISRELEVSQCHTAGE